MNSLLNALLSTALAYALLVLAPFWLKMGVLTALLFQITKKL